LVQSAAERRPRGSGMWAAEPPLKGNVANSVSTRSRGQRGRDGRYTASWPLLTLMMPRS